MQFNSWWVVNEQGQQGYVWACSDLQAELALQASQRQGIFSNDCILIAEEQNQNILSNEDINI